MPVGYLLPRELPARDAEPLDEFAVGHRPGQGKALEQIATEVGEDARLLLRLDAFRHNFDAERFADVDQRLRSSGRQ